MIKYILIIILMNCSKLYCQDTLVYANSNSKAIQDQYFLFTRTNTFEHTSTSDKLETWYGKGKYELVKNKLKLIFGDSDRFKKTNLVKHLAIYDLPNSKNDTIIVKFLREAKTPIDGHLKFNKKLYQPDDEKGVIRLSKNIFKNTENPKIEVYINNQYKEIELEKIELLRALAISHYDFSETFHFESNFEKIIQVKKSDLISHSEYLKKCNLNLDLLMKSFEKLGKEN